MKALSLSVVATFLAAAITTAMAASTSPFEPSVGATLSQDRAQNEGAVFMRTKERAVVRNFQDENGAPLATLEAGTLVRAFRSSTGKPVFREVEVAGGFPVWVYGEFLQPTDAEGVLLVTGNRVNMRPLPETSPGSMALRSKLDAGQRVKMIERARKATAFREDWIRVQAPTSTKAWVVDGSLEPYEARLGAAEWREKNVPLPSARPRRVEPKSPPILSLIHI